jgi:hypothetical protein
MAYALVRPQLPGRMLIARCMLFAYMFPALLLALPGGGSPLCNLMEAKHE